MIRWIHYYIYILFSSKSSGATATLRRLARAYLARFTFQRFNARLFSFEKGRFGRLVAVASCGKEGEFGRHALVARFNADLNKRIGKAVRRVGNQSIQPSYERQCVKKCNRSIKGRNTHMAPLG